MLNKHIRIYFQKKLVFFAMLILANSILIQRQLNDRKWTANIALCLYYRVVYDRCKQDEMETVMENWGM